MATAWAIHLLLRKVDTALPPHLPGLSLTPPHVSKCDNSLICQKQQKVRRASLCENFGSGRRDASCHFLSILVFFLQFSFFFKVSLLNFLRSYSEHLNLKKGFNAKFQLILLPSGNYRGPFFHFNCATYMLILILVLFHFPVFCACPFCVHLTLL